MQRTFRFPATAAWTIAFAAAPVASFAGESESKAPFSVVTSIDEVAQVKSDEPSVVEVRIVTRSGQVFQGITNVTPQLKRFFTEVGDVRKMPAKNLLEVHQFNGLNGSIGIRFGDMDRVELITEVSPEQVKESTTAMEEERAERWRVEQERLDGVAAAREAKRQAEQQGAAAAAPSEIPDEPIVDGKIHPSLQKWLDEFPPEKGWVPARKAQLYYQSVVLGNGALQPEERRWLDHYDAWLEAFSAWRELNAAEGEDGAAGEALDDPGTPARNVDGATSSTWRDMQKPADLKPDAPKPTDLDADAPKPTDLDADAPKPEPVPANDGE